MPNIPQYQQPDINIRPSEVGPEAFAAAGRRAGAFYNQAGESLAGLGREIGGAVKSVGDTAVDYMDHQQINAGAKHGADLTAKLTESWNQAAASADPHDPTVAAKWRNEVLEPALDQFSQGFSTDKSQDWASGFANRMRTEMYRKSEADMSSLAGEAVSDTVHTIGNQFSNTAVSDPSSVPFLLSQVDHSIDGVIGANPNLKGADAGRVRLEVAEKTKEAIVKAGAFGAIQKAGDPEAAAASWARQYPQYINGQEELMFARAAKTQAKANTLIGKQTEIANRQLADLQVHQAATKTISDNISFDPQSGKPIIDPKFYKQTLDIAHQNPNAPNAAETVRTMLNWGETQQNKGDKAADDPAVKSALMDGMFSPDKPTTALDLMKAHAEGKLSDSSFQAMHGLVTELSEAPLKDPVWKDTIDAVKSELVLSNVGLPGKDIIGEANYAKWAQTFIPQYLTAKRAGTLQPNALDLKDPNSFISQSLNAPGLKRSVAQRAQDYMSVLSGFSPEAEAPKVTTKDQFDALKSGTTYIGADGKTYRKP